MLLFFDFLSFPHVMSCVWPSERWHSSSQPRRGGQRTIDRMVNSLVFINTNKHMYADSGLCTTETSFSKIYIRLPTLVWPRDHLSLCFHHMEAENAFIFCVFFTAPSFSKFTKAIKGREIAKRFVDTYGLWQGAKAKKLSIFKGAEEGLVRASSKVGGLGLAWGRSTCDRQKSLSKWDQGWDGTSSKPTLTSWKRAICSLVAWMLLKIDCPFHSSLPWRSLLHKKPWLMITVLRSLAFGFHSPDLVH